MMYIAKSVAALRVESSHQHSITFAPRGAYSHASQDGESAPASTAGARRTSDMCSPLNEEVARMVGRRRELSNEFRFAYHANSVRMTWETSGA